MGGGVSGLCRGCVVVVWGLFMFVFWIGSGLAGSWLGVVSAVVRGCLCFVRGCFGDVSGVLGVCLVGCVGAVWGLFWGWFGVVGGVKPLEVVPEPLRLGFMILRGPSVSHSSLYGYDAHPRQQRS